MNLRMTLLLDMLEGDLNFLHRILAEQKVYNLKKKSMNEIENLEDQLFWSTLYIIFITTDLYINWIAYSKWPKFFLHFNTRINQSVALLPVLQSVTSTVTWCECGKTVDRKPMSCLPVRFAVTCDDICLGYGGFLCRNESFLFILPDGAGNFRLGLIFSGRFWG